MTKEELKRDADKYADMNCVFQHIRSISKSEDIIRRIRNLITLTYIHSAEPREGRISELDKENGKLEGKLADLQSEYIELENFHNNEVNGLKTQLSKANEIIKKFLLWENDWHKKTESKYELLKQAEQFLKEKK